MLYPSELATGMRIYVEYDKLNPNLVRVDRRLDRQLDKASSQAAS